MNAKRALIESQTPKFAVSQTSVDREVVNDVARAIELAESVSDMKILAFAFYVGAIEIREIAARLPAIAALTALLREQLASLPPQDAESIARIIDHHLHDYAGALVGLSADEGWTILVLDLISASECLELTDLEVSDSAFLLLRWMLYNVWDVDRMQKLLNTWASKNDALFIDASSVLVWRSVELQLSKRGGMLVFEGLVGKSQAIICGTVLSRLLRWQSNHQRSDAQNEQALDVMSKLKEAVVQAVRTRGDLKTFARHAKSSDDVLTLPFLLSLNVSPPVRDQVLRDGQQTLERIFVRSKERDPLSSKSFLYAAQWMIEPLAHVTIKLPMSVELFDSLASNLRYDEAAYQLMFSHYLVDRPRAIVLCAIGSIASSVLGDCVLGASVEALLSTLRALPANHEILTTALADEIYGKYGVRLVIA